jgi:hypothetical protein
METVSPGRPATRQKEAADGVLTAKQAPHRPGTAPALGLIAGETRVFDDDGNDRVFVYEDANRNYDNANRYHQRIENLTDNGVAYAGGTALRLLAPVVAGTSSAEARVACTRTVAYPGRPTFASRAPITCLQSSSLFLQHGPA